MYAVIALQWHQYIVTEWTQIVVDQLDLQAGETVQPDVLALFSLDGKTAKFGTPTLDAKVVCTVDDHQRGDKIRVVKFKRKNRYERNFGHRSYQSLLTVTSLHG